MKTNARYYILLLAFLSLATLVRADDLTEGLNLYKTGLRQALTELPPESPDEEVNLTEARTYLKLCLIHSSVLEGIELTNPGVSTALKQFATLHNEARDVVVTGTPRHPSIRVEHAAYVEHLQGINADAYLAWAKLQNQLLERKYFKTSTSENANFLESYVNGHLSLTKSDPGGLRQIEPPKPLGVSPWEALFRFEPTLAMRGGPQPAIMGTAGLTHTFFPDVIGGVRPTLQETSWSRSLKKAGGRIGIGVGEVNDKTELLLGVGLQLHSVGIWAVYEPDQEIWMLGLSTADLKKLRKAIGVFD